MKRIYCLIKNISGWTYWSYRLSCPRLAELESHKQAMAIYGTIYVNRSGGWFDEKSVDKILVEVVREDFPAKDEIVSTDEQYISR